MKTICLVLSVIFSLQIFSQPSLRGTKKSHKAQHQHAKQEDLSYIKNDVQLASMKEGGYLVPITSKVKVDPRLAKKFRHVRPWTNAFLGRFQTAFSKKFGTNAKIKVNSAVRTEAYQKELCKRNGNAAKASSHPTGATIDIAKKGMTDQ